MPGANELLFDRANRHEVDIRRYSNRQIRQMLRYLEELDAKTVTKLREALPRIVKPGQRNSVAELSESQRKRLEQLLVDIRLLRETALKTVGGDLKKELADFAVAEADFEARLIQGAIPIAEVTVATVSAMQIRAVVNTNAFKGQLLTDLMGNLRRQDQARITEAVVDGFVSGETTDNIVRKIVGTRASGYTDGLTSITRREASTIARTALTTYADTARQEVWNANADIIVALRWTSTLDGRTSSVCRSRDGKLVPQGGNTPPEGADLLDPPGARPAAHPNCRSRMVPQMGWEGVFGDRPYVTDTRNRRKREIDFRADAKANAGPARWKEMSQKQRNAAIRDVREAWAREAIGTVPAKTTYQQWLKRQPAKFQDDVLGKTKGALFRRGGLQLDQFVDHSGKELTLPELKSKFPDAFEEANV